MTTGVMEAHPDHTMYASKVYDYALELLIINPNRTAKNLQKMISYWKNVPMPPLRTMASWRAHPQNLVAHARAARKREAEEKAQQ